MQYERPRAEFPLLLNEWGLIEVGVEVGTCQGLFAKNLLDFWPGHLHCVDPWAQIPGYEEQYDHGTNYVMTLKNLEAHKGRYTIHRTTSLEAAKEFPDESLDFCYLDGNHSYQAVKEDIEAWYPKVKIGGLIGGDDFGIVPEQWCDFGHGRVRFGVRRAVDEWSQKVRKNISIDIFADWNNSIPGQGELRARGWWCIR
jgi:hypothetical protein